MLFGLFMGAMVVRESRARAEAELERVEKELEKALAQASEVNARYHAIMDECDRLSADIRRGKFGPGAPPQFSRADLKALVSLCHPDKHGGKPRANDITVKILALLG